MRIHNDKKSEFAFNTHIIIYIFLLLMLLAISIIFVVENEVGGAIFFALSTLLVIIILLISPLYFVFSDEKVEIFYHFGQRVQIEWKTVRNISLTGSWVGAGGPPHFIFTYPCVEKQLFFVTGEIPKTGKTKKLIKKYYKKEIQY